MPRYKALIQHFVRKILDLYCNRSLAKHSVQNEKSKVFHLRRMIYSLMA